MFKEIAEEITRTMVTSNIINIEDRELYTYGLELLIPKTVFYIIVLVLSLLTDTFFPSLLFILFYMSVRSFSGGYHSKTAGFCIVVSTFIYLLMDFLMKLDFERMELYLLLAAAVSVGVIFVFSPVESEEKPITADERKRYRLFAELISMVLLIITAGAYYFRLEPLFYPAAWSLTADAVLIIIAKAVSEKYGKSKEEI
ncbi:MAG: accessory gene regulator ArgB-like protein [Huintestinicola sp.]